MRRIQGFVAVFALSAVAACGDNIPTAPTSELTLCGPNAWIAHQNEGGEWTRVDVINGSFTLLTTERLGIAIGRGDGIAVVPSLTVYFLTAQQAAATFPCSYSSAPLYRTLSGEMRGLHADEYASLSFGASSSTLPAASPAFTFNYVPQGLMDIVAARQPPYWVALHVDRLIIRRAQDPPSGTTLPAFDFESSEAFAPQSNALTITGLPTGTRWGAQTNFLTQSGTDNVLLYWSVEDGSNATSTINYSVPTSRLIMGDLHQLSVSGGRRDVTVFYREPEDRTVAFGPPVSTPSFITVASSPNLRLRADVASQAEYGSYVNIFYDQGAMGSSRRMAFLTATKEYLGGTPTTWSLTIPDLSRVDGFQSLWGLQPGAYTWDVYVTDRPYGFSLRTPQEGEIFRSAYVSGPP